MDSSSLQPAHRARMPRLAIAMLPLVIGTVVLAGCAGGSWPGTSTDVPPATTGGPSDDVVAATPTDDAPEPEPPADAEPSAQAETCDWEAAIVAGELPDVPEGQDGALEDVIIGSWQHLAFDDGEGYQALAPKDIRYVFPGSERMLYCQHVPGITEHAQNAADITWDGTTIVLPGGRAGFTATAWDADTMVWRNEIDGSHYLLARR